MRFIVSMPTLAQRRAAGAREDDEHAGMSMNAAGLVPSIMALNRMPTKARPIPMPVEGFIGLSSAVAADPSVAWTARTRFGRYSPRARCRPALPRKL